MPVFTVGTIDIGANNKENLLAAINAEHGTTYTLAEYDFTEPERVTIQNPRYNSKIKLGPRAATGMIGFKTFYYNRIHVSEIGPLKITWQNEQFLTELLPRLAEKYGIPLTVDDVFEQVIVPPVAPETEVALTLNFKDSSVAYYGGSFIVLGLMDPALEFELPQQLPFKNDLVFYVNGFTKTKTGENYLESSILSIASDKLRSRTFNVTKVDQAPFVSILKNTYSDTQRLALEQYLPFVFSWTVGDTKAIRGVNIYGDVIEVNETSNLAVKKSNLIAFDPLSTSELNNIRSKIMVREGTQDADGNIYILVGDPVNSTVKLMKSTDDGLTFAEVTVTKTNRASFNYANWEDVVIHDLMVIGNKLSILVTNPVTYGSNPSKSSNGPAVEVFDLTTGVSDYFPINPEFVTNTNFSLVFNKQSNMRFVSPETPQAILDVVAIGRTSKTLEHVVVYCHREDSQEFTAEIMGTQFLDNPIYGIAAFSKALAKDVNGRFVSIQILSMVPTSKRDDFFLVETGIRGENSAMGYGVVSISGIRKGTQLGGWDENILDLGGGSQPSMVTVTNNGKRNHYVFAGGNGIFNVKYEEDEPNVYFPDLIKVFDVGSHPGFDLECDIGNGNFVTHDVTENPAMAPIYSEFPDEESVKLPIGFSFMAKHKVTGQPIWLVAPDSATALTERTIGAEYKHLGGVPVAVFSDSTGAIYLWSKIQGIYKTVDGGNSWTDFAAIGSYYSNPNYIGQAEIKLKPQDFKAISVKGDITYAQINPVRSLEVFDKPTMNPEFALELNDDVVYRVDGTKPAGENQFNSAYITTRLNSTSDFSPRKVIGWDTDASNSIRALAKFTENGAAAILNQVDIPVALEEDAIAVYLDVEFIGLKAVVLTKSNADGSNLHLVDENDVVVRHGLQFSNAPTFPQFSPVGIQPLWVGNDDVLSYTPVIVTSTSKEVLVLERDGLGGNPITVNMLSLVVPGDNGKPIEYVPMFNSNRRDLYVFQQDNGLFKIEYSWDGAGTTSVITLVKVFDTASLNVETVYSGCEVGLPDMTPYGESTIGPWPPYGDKLGEDCNNYDKRHKLADGFGGYFWKVVEVNSEDCGYTVPTPADTGYGGGNFNIG